MNSTLNEIQNTLKTADIHVLTVINKLKRTVHIYISKVKYVYLEYLYGISTLILTLRIEVNVL